MYSSAEAVKKLFGVDIAKPDHRSFKDSITTLEGKDLRSRILEYERFDPDPGKRNGRRLYREEHLPWLNNVILIQGFFPKPGRIKELLSNHEDIVANMQRVRCEIHNRSNVGKIEFNGARLISFFEMVDSKPDYRVVKLPNPFITLPQVHGLSVIGALNHESDYMADLCDMLGAYYRKDIVASYEVASKLRENAKCTVSPELDRMVRMVEDKYSEAIDFSRLIDTLN